MALFLEARLANLTKHTNKILQLRQKHHRNKHTSACYKHVPYDAQKYVSKSTSQGTDVTNKCENDNMYDSFLILITQSRTVHQNLAHKQSVYITLQTVVIQLVNSTCHKFDLFD